MRKWQAPKLVQMELASLIGKKVVADLLLTISSTRDLRDRLLYILPLYLSSSTLDTNVTKSSNLIHIFQPLEHVCTSLKAYTVLLF